MSHAYNVLTHANAYLLSDSPVKLDDAKALTTAVPTCDTTRGDLANALQLLASVTAASDEDAETLDAIKRRLLSALCKTDDLLSDLRAMRAATHGQQQELDAMRQQRLTMQGHAYDAERAIAALISECMNR